ncbi:MAG TPA: 7-carboxy-7-deazaguanine synthase [Baekduia sp.]|uniref:7-carboxy-7-deazaguanine synthase n=1 Tax=Baekduia sp. TaxID=2600305 RepID=UPI002C852C26|nr:7-carboxy-7-deazaguanine synthase [Baekduia sp.]HMJ34113.1 7-carboxy-7-deazaguanine synthase [Baekduia sp.]
MPYTVKELYYTLQGEGVHAGRAAVFCRFAGCNLWNGREADRQRAVCSFCDTDFVGVDGPGGGRYETPEALADAAAALWPGSLPARERGAWLVCTGGEPTLQLDGELVDAFLSRGFKLAVETNGTRPLPDGLDWVCVSPKAAAELAVRVGDELKVVFPQANLDLDALGEMDFTYHSIQPMDGAERDANTMAAVRYCLEHPPWRLTLQTHKLVGLR